MSFIGKLPEDQCVCENDTRDVFLDMSDTKEEEEVAKVEVRICKECGKTKGFLRVKY